MQGFRLDAERHAQISGDHESCGLVVDGIYWPCRNIADDPCSDFAIDPRDYAAAALRGAIQAVVHSHPKGGPASEADKRACTVTELPWHIWSVPEKQWTTIKPC